jgi:hypothetical protein
VFDKHNSRDIFRGKFISERSHTFADDERVNGATGVFRNVLCRRERFKARTVPLVLALLGDDENFHG